MKTRSLLHIANFGVIVFLTATLQAEEPLGFEPEEGFSVGTDISTIKSWKSSTEAIATISDEEASAGTQSLKIVPSAEDAFVQQAFPVLGGDILFIDFAIKPSADASEEPVSMVDANGAVLGFVAEGKGGRVYAVPEDAPSVDTGHKFSIDEQNAARNWIRVTIRQDIKAKRWDLFLDGRLALIDQPLSPSAKGRPAITIYASAAGDAYLDDVTVGAGNPLFPDADGDGMPDAEEEANGLNPSFNDRNSLLIGTQSTAIEQFLRLGKIVSSESWGRRVIFVDNGAGSDAFTGALSYRAGGGGPKASFQAALKEADDMMLIVVLPGKGPYRTPTSAELESGKGTQINLVPIGDVFFE